jgi:hypothetical protein
MSILTRVQANPEISTNNSAYVTELITRAQDWIRRYCCLPLYPVLSQAYIKSAADAGTNLTALTTNSFWIAVNGSGLQEIELTLANCTSGAATATEMQTQIRAVDADMFDEVTVAYSGTQYTITTGRYGEGGSIEVWFQEDYKHVLQTTKLHPVWGATEYAGMAADDQLDTACVMLAEILYRKAGIEGVKQAAVPGGISITEHDLDPMLFAILKSKRRLFP